MLKLGEIGSISRAYHGRAATSEKNRWRWCWGSAGATPLPLPLSRPSPRQPLSSGRRRDAPLRCPSLLARRQRPNGASGTGGSDQRWSRGGRQKPIAEFRVGGRAYGLGSGALDMAWVGVLEKSCHLLILWSRGPPGPGLPSFNDQILVNFNDQQSYGRRICKLGTCCSWPHF